MTATHNRNKNLSIESHAICCGLARTHFSTNVAAIPSQINLKSRCLKNCVIYQNPRSHCLWVETAATLGYQQSARFRLTINNSFTVFVLLWLGLSNYNETSWWRLGRSRIGDALGLVWHVVASNGARKRGEWGLSCQLNTELQSQISSILKIKAYAKPKRRHLQSHPSSGIKRSAANLSW